MNYFILVRNDIDKPYNKGNLKNTKSEFWSSYNDSDEPRKHAEVYDSIQNGDLILCYSAKEKEICAILEVGAKSDDGITLEFKNALNISLESIKAHYESILALSPEKYSPFTKDMSNIFFGTFFESNESQFFYICGLDFVN